ncbi:MAG TPA: hypothetical protein PKE55_01655 [Kiritimatiellia bacterium]|nr:hypothetical protein [Kiritimatiellia bacterium]
MLQEELRFLCPERSSNIEHTFRFRGNVAKVALTCTILLPSDFVLQDWNENVPISRQNDQFVLHATFTLALDTAMALSPPLLNHTLTFNQDAAHALIKNGEIIVGFGVDGHGSGRMIIGPATYQ